MNDKTPLVYIVISKRKGTSYTGGISNVQKVTTYPTSIHPVFYGI